MVIFALEQALGDYAKIKHFGSPVIEHDKTIATCLARSGSNEETKELKLAKAIAESYFEELLQICQSIVKGTSDEKAISDLTTLVKSLNIYEVRNAVAHPNRDFQENYWYRCAVIATSLPIVTLELDSVARAFQAALDGKISLPPEEWLDRFSSVIANNLPRETEHDATGLIGRQSEKKMLLSYIRSGRHSIVVVTGPGGLGKTALTTEVLREYVQDYENNPVHQAVVFISLKEESLTADGVIKLAREQSIQQLKHDLAEALTEEIFSEALSDTFEGVISEFSHIKILLFIDNVETLLRDAPDDFVNFCDELPREWTVVATSRVTVDGGRTLALNQLSQADAQHLIYRYSNSKQIELKSDAVAKLTRDCQGNPLALRLTIDFIDRGKTLEVATRKATDDVVSYSFKNLISSLPNQCLSILECLFLRSRIGRGEIISLLTLSSEDVAQYARILSKTSLVKREVLGDEEYFDLNPAVRDLLRNSPASLETRRHIQKTIENQRKEIVRHRNINKNQGINEFHKDFIPDDTPTALSNTYVKVIRYLKSDKYNYHYSNKLIKELNDFTYSNQQEWRIYMFLGELYFLVLDDTTASAHFKQAIEKSSGFFVAVAVWCDHLIKRHNYSEAYELLEDLFERYKGSDLFKDDNYSSKIWFIRLRCMMGLLLYDEIIDLPACAQKNTRLDSLIRIFKAEAYLRKVSSSHSDRNAPVAMCINQSITLLMDAIDTGYYSKTIHRCVPFFIKEIRHYMSLVEPSECHTELLQLIKLLPKFSTKLMEWDMLDTGDRDLVSKFIIWCREHRHSELNLQFSSQVFNNLLGIVDTDQFQKWAKINNFTLAKIYRLPNSEDRDGIRRFCFAQTEQQEQLFIHRENVHKLDFIKWINLRVGDAIAVDRIQSAKGDNLPTPEKVYLA
jgi:tetratricopeptide (TPR) repeat protein